MPPAEPEEGSDGDETRKSGWPKAARSGENLLFLTDEQLRKGIEAMFFAYRGFTADPDRILAEHVLWPRASPGAALHQSLARARR
jgi:hypothetical protein